MEKQATLKPQDLVVALKVAVNHTRAMPYAALAEELGMSASETHAAVQRAKRSGLLTMEEARPEAIFASLIEFVLHGVRYAFPPQIGAVVRGIPTAAGAPVLAHHFADNSEVMVWPHPEGRTRGTALQPLFKSVPAASLIDAKLYDVLAIVDAIRAGSAREREIGRIELQRLLR
ncbi:MarR family transcriptional regulator [Luteibacter jiangsuensis]